MTRLQTCASSPRSSVSLSPACNLRPATQPPACNLVLCFRPILLFLNKKDLFEKKIKETDLKVFP